MKGTKGEWKEDGKMDKNSRGDGESKQGKEKGHWAGGVCVGSHPEGIYLARRRATAATPSVCIIQGTSSPFSDVAAEECLPHWAGHIWAGQTYIMSCSILRGERYENWARMQVLGL